MTALHRLQTRLRLHFGKDVRCEPSLVKRTLNPRRKAQAVQRRVGDNQGTLLPGSAPIANRVIAKDNLRGTKVPHRSPVEPLQEGCARRLTRVLPRV